MQTYNYAGGENSHQIQNITWELKKDEVYTLTAKDKSNGRYVSYESFPTFDDHIQIDGRIAGSGGLGTFHWYNFNNFTTTFTAPPIETPVPAALWLFGTGVITLFGFNKTQRKSRDL